MKDDLREKLGENYTQPALPRLIQRWLKHLAFHADTCPEVLERIPKEALDAESLASHLEQLSDHLETQQETLRIEATIFDNLKEGVVVTDSDGKIIRINRSYSQITGYQEEEIRGKRPGDFLRSGRHSAEFYQLMWSEVMDVGRWQGEVWNRRKNGELFLELLTITAVKNARGEVSNLVGVFGDITDLRRIEHKLTRLNHYDSLTNLPNRTLITDHLTRHILQTNRAERIFGVACFDLDNFKDINTRFGESAGDRVLLEIANRLHGAIREGDIVGRTGGDEFVIIMTNLASNRSVEPSLKRLQDQLSMPMQVNGVEFMIGCSIGVTVYPDDRVDAETLLRHADQALVMAKHAGRGSIKLFDHAEEVNTRQQQQQIERLRQALRQGELHLFYQPKLNLRSGRTIGAEALLRWRHPELGLLAPGAFLHYAEGHSLMVELGDWVIESALQQLDNWIAQGLDIEVSVNVAAIQLQEPDFVDKLRAALARYPNVRPDQFEVEILESSAVRDLEQTLSILHDCRQLGIGLALDDFGTGYCSLSYLKHLPATTLKIDQSFIRSMLGKREDLGLVEGIISIAKVFDMNIIAEGMETPEHGVLLLRLGCDTAQGYGIAKPMPAGELPDWINAFVPHPSWTTWARLDWDLSDFPLIVAQYDHIDWVRRILQALESEGQPLKAEDLHDHMHCRLGKWYYGRGQKNYGLLTEFKVLEQLHKEIHMTGPRILELLAKGQKDAARAESMVLLELKARILELMQSLQTAVARQHGNPSAQSA